MPLELFGPSHRKPLLWYVLVNTLYNSEAFLFDYSGVGALGAERGTSFGPHAISFFFGPPADLAVVTEKR